MMTTAAAIDALARRQLMEQIYDKMSDDEKCLFLQQSLQGVSMNEVMQALQKQDEQLKAIAEHTSRQSWLSDFGANIAGNAVFDGAVWLLSRLVRMSR